MQRDGSSKVDLDPLGGRLINALPHEARRRASSILHRERFWHAQELRRTQTSQGFSFAQFDALRCIFVHIPKAAGISVSQGLFGNLGGGHVSIAVYRIVFPKEEFDSYFKFAFVRNPWDRLLSAYTFLKQGGVDELDRRWWADHGLARYRNFEEFVTGWVNRDNVETGLHFLPQYRYICAPFTRTICVDFVGRYEHIERDYAYVRERLGLPSAELPHLNRTPTPAGDFHEHYSAQTREIVQNVYREDIELFDYSFEEAVGGAHGGPHVELRPV